MSSLPSSSTLIKGVVITAVSLVIINFVKPYLPQSARDLLGG